jgi:hypothetical protein
LTSQNSESNEMASSALGAGAFFGAAGEAAGSDFCSAFSFDLIVLIL